MNGLKKTSIIIPTINSLMKLNSLVVSIIKQKKINKKIIKILIIQNNKKFFFEKKPKFFQKKKLNIEVYNQKKIGLHNARDLGIKISRTNNLVLLDDDIILGNYHIFNMIKSLNKFDLVGGPNLIKENFKIPKWIKKFYFKKNKNNQIYCPYLSYLDFGKTSKIIDSSYIFGMNMGFKKKIYYKLNGFHPDLIGKDYGNFFIGDGETGFLNKCKKNKIISFYNSHCKVYHRLTNERLLKSYFIERSKYHAISESFSILKDKPQMYFAIPRLIKKIIILMHLNIKSFFMLERKKLYYKYKLPIEKMYAIYFIKHHFLYLFNNKIYNWVNRKNYF
jgi:hypothetical protein